MLVAEKLTKDYGTFRALDEVSFTIESGEIVGLLGPNGAGKTTTMRLLTGYMAPTAGEIRIGDYDLLEQPRQAKQQIGYLPEQPPLYPELTVIESLRFAAQLHGADASVLRELIPEVIEQLSLTDVQNCLTGQLSRGYQQRTGLAQVLVTRPSILILDEPTIGLDPQQIAEMRTLIKGLAGRYTVILSSHILQEVSATCDRLLIMNQGKLVASGSHEQLMSMGQQQKSIRLALQNPQVELMQKALSGLASVKTVEVKGESGAVQFYLQVQNQDALYPELFQLLQAKQWVPMELSVARSTLEEVFLDMTRSSL